MRQPVTSHAPADPRPRGDVQPRLTGRARRAMVGVLSRAPFAPLWQPLTRGAAVVFMLHRFEDPEQGVHGFEPQTLRRLLGFLRRRKHHLVGLKDVLLSLRGEGPPLRRAVAFTIDDGYREQATVAAPIFAEFDCPVTTFVTTGFLDRRLWFWWDQIEYIFTRSERPRFDLVIEGAVLRYALGEHRPTTAAQADFIGRCKRLADTAKHASIQALAAVADVELPAAPPARFTPMSWDELRTAEGRGMTFGPHTVSHPILSRTDDAQSRYEIEESWRRLRTEARSPVPIFAYPNGQPSDFGAREIATARAIGLAGACTGVPGYATPRRYRAPDGPFQIPRFAFPDDVAYVAQFVTGLEQLKRFLRGMD